MKFLPLILALFLYQDDVKPDPSKGKGGKAGTFKTKEIDVKGTTREYRLNVPKSLDLKKPNVLVFAFHGRGGSKDRMPLYCGLDKLASKEKFILVYPSAHKGNWNLRPGKNEDLDYFDAVFDEITKKYNVDLNRVYLTGMSMGGYFSNFCAANRSEKIAAIAPHSGGLGALAFGGIKAKYKYAALIIHGDEDKVVPVSEGRKSRDAYKKAGHKHEYKEIGGLGHVWATKQKINADIWKFFKENPRKKK